MLLLGYTFVSCTMSKNNKTITFFFKRKDEIVNEATVKRQKASTSEPFGEIRVEIRSDFCPKIV